MIVADNAVFPNNIVDLVATRCALIDTDLFVIKRPLRNTDPNQSIGVVAALWAPDQESLEMRGFYPAPPTLQRYSITVQAFVKHMDEVEGLNTHSVLSMLLRSMLYNDGPLRVGLSSLQSTLNGTTEQSQRWGIAQQRFFSNEISGDWLYLSTLEFWLETETR